MTPSEEIKDPHNQAADVLEVVERAPEPAPPATSSGASAQSIPGTIRPQPAGHPPLGQ